jgi:thioester reductase-like protein
MNITGFNLCILLFIYRPANVSGTIYVIQFASTIKQKVINYISSTSVFGNHFQSVYEVDSIEKENIATMGGYERSKWVSEMLIWGAKGRGFPVRVFRPGL